MRGTKGEQHASQSLIDLCAAAVCAHRRVDDDDISHRDERDCPSSALLCDAASPFGDEEESIESLCEAVDSTRTTTNACRLDPTEQR